MPALYGAAPAWRATSAEQHSTNTMRAKAIARNDRKHRGRSLTKTAGAVCAVVPDIHSASVDAVPSGGW